MSSTHQPKANSRVQRAAVERAVAALLKWIHHHRRHQHDDFLYLILTLKKIPHKGRFSPVRLPIPHSFLSSSTCLLVDDRPNSHLSPPAARDAVRDLSLPVAQILSLSDLRSVYNSVDARRALPDEYDLFLADRRIVPLLPGLLGKSFFKKKNAAVPINFSRQSWAEQLLEVCGSTILQFRAGTCTGIRIARASQGRDKIIENVIKAIDGAAGHVPRKWANVRSLHIKATESLALPIYQAVSGLDLEEEDNVDEFGEEQQQADAEEVGKVKRSREMSEKKENVSKKRKSIMKKSRSRGELK
ncbi:uncharacterized protein [Typha latifolia]|uniref:uncharacterized protein n=1 Tax=Typha latifolia TaxID=4733 RepID=UPI003C2FD4E2